MGFHASLRTVMPTEDACIDQDYKRMRSGVSSSKHAAVYLWFIKFCENEEYADQFLAGDLYLNPLAYFRNIESTGDQGRNDSTEAIAMWWQPKDISMVLDFPGIGRTEITAKDLAAPVSMSFNYHDSLNILSLYTIYVSGFEYKDDKFECEEEGAAELRRQLAIDPRCFSLGKFAVVTQAALFIKQLREAMRTQGYKVAGRLVEYYDDETFHGEVPVPEIPFRKQKRFSYQKEYRVCVNSGGAQAKPTRLKIGDISAFSAKMESSRIPTILELKLEQAPDPQ
jgi:hypothetical protein